MPFKSEKQRRWMHANEPEMADEWEEKEKSEMQIKGSELKRIVAEEVSALGITSRGLGSVGDLGPHITNGAGRVYPNPVLQRTPPPQSAALPATLAGLAGAAVGTGAVEAMGGPAANYTLYDMMKSGSEGDKARAGMQDAADYIMSGEIFKETTQIKGSELKQIVAEELQKLLHESHTKEDEEELKKISDELKGAVKMHQSQADRIDKVLDSTDDEDLEEGKKKNCGCGQDPCKTYGIQEEKNKDGKEQGADGKACWDGYKYAGTEDGKDKCVPMEEKQDLDAIIREELGALLSEGDYAGHYLGSYLVTAAGDTPEDIAREMQTAGIEITDESATQAALEAGVLDDDLPDFIDAIIDAAESDDSEEPDMSQFLQ